MRAHTLEKAAKLRVEHSDDPYIPSWESVATSAHMRALIEICRIAREISIVHLDDYPLLIGLLPKRVPQTIPELSIENIDRV